MPRQQSSESTNERKYRDHVPTVDIVLQKEAGEILIEKRGRDPFKGLYSLPGGHVDYGETVEAAILREIMEECSITADLITILGVYSDPNRDPRGQRISTVFIGKYKDGELKAGDDAEAAEWVNLDRFLETKNRDQFAFDHRLILTHYKRWLGEQKATCTFWSTI